MFSTNAVLGIRARVVTASERVFILTLGSNKTSQSNVRSVSTRGRLSNSKCRQFNNILFVSCDYGVRFYPNSVSEKVNYSTSAMGNDKGYSNVNQEEARRFMEDCLKAAGANPQSAAQQAAVMLEADRQGHYSHGMNRLAMYVNDIRTDACHPNAKPQILKESASTAWVDGAGALGATVGDFCMDLAIKKAKETGVGWVAAKHSNHYGIAGWYSMQALKHGLIGMSFTNTSPLMAPTRSKKAALGTNPIALGAPAENGDRFLLDMATTAVAVGKIEIQRRKDEPIPQGWAQGPDGNITTDANLAFDTGCLMPVGGAEETSGYKGYGLGAMVEILCGISAGSLYGPHIRSWSHQGVGGEANLGQCFIAMDPGNFAPGFEGRMSDLLHHLRNLDPADLSKPVLAPGDKEVAMTKKTDETGVIPYHPNQIMSCEELSQLLNIPPIKHQPI